MGVSGGGIFGCLRHYLRRTNDQRAKRNDANAFEDCLFHVKLPAFAMMNAL
jgi:hypothetical protein